MSRTPTKGPGSGLGTGLGTGGSLTTGKGGSLSRIPGINTPRVPTSLQSGVAISEEGLAKAGKQLMADQQLGRNLQWLHDVKGGLVSFLLDKSGSMGYVKKMVIEGYNEYVGALRKYRSIGFSFYQFDSESYEPIFEARPVDYVPMLTNETYQPNGGTPLYDSLIETIKRVDSMVQQGRIPANRVIITTMTDGGDTSGKSPDELRRWVAERQRRGYQFQFLGAGINGYELSVMMGITPESTMSFDTSKMEEAFDVMAQRQIEYLQGRAKDASFKGEDRKKLGDKHAPPTLLLK